ncbi:MAG TPA: rubrerythrin [Anaerolineaceae bacterium]|nr:MAG: rubrerythrin [Chloroflexi bacterium GWB2_54_36]HAL15578.1 rubrerythrin [Anaerolineaceae bacterium]
MTKTLDNLQAAFAGESQANRKYTAFAQKADAEGQPQIARLFRAAAHAETVHALAHFRAMEGVGNTLTNLQAAINGEHYEVVEMYPPFIKDAEAEGDRRALRSFSYAWEVEKTHESLYREALALLEEGKKEEDEYDYYVCPVCGHTHKRNAPEVCPVCGAPGSRFEKVA